MVETLKALVVKEGMAAVLATLRNVLEAEAFELVEMDGETDAATARKIEDMGRRLLEIANEYAALSE